MFLLNTCESRVMVAPVWTITGNGSIEILSRLAGSGLPSGKNDEKSWIWFFHWFHRKSRIPLLLEAPPGNYWIDFFSTNQNCDIKHKGNIERRFLWMWEFHLNAALTICWGQEEWKSQKSPHVSESDLFKDWQRRREKKDKDRNMFKNVQLGRIAARIFWSFLQQQIRFLYLQSI